MSAGEPVYSLEDRWFGPEGSTRFHYFDGDLRALCGKWMLWRDPVDVGLGWGVAIGNANGDCAACKKKLTNLAEKEEAGRIEAEREQNEYRQRVWEEENRG